MGERPTKAVSMLETMTTSRLAARKISGLLARAAWAKRRRSRKRPATSDDRDGDHALDRDGDEVGPAIVAHIGRKGAQREDDGDERQILEQEHRKKAARPTGDCVPEMEQHQRAVEDKARASPRPMAAAQLVAEHDENEPDEDSAHGEFGSTKPEYIAAHRPEPLEGQFQADREQQQRRCRIRRRSRPRRCR